jgi:single-strand DNA-binding protein
MQLIGLCRLGRDAEARTVGENVVANLSLAFDYYDPKAEKKRSTTWIDAALWGRQAEALEQYLLKGSQVCVTVDDLHIEEYQGKHGIGHKLVGRVSSSKLAGGRQDSGGAPAQAPAPASRAAAPAPRPPAARAPAPLDDDMDVPF